MKEQETQTGYIYDREVGARKGKENNVRDCAKKEGNKEGEKKKKGKIIESK